MCIPRGEGSFRTKNVISNLVPLYQSHGATRGSCAEACTSICSHQNCKADYAISSNGKSCSCMKDAKDLCSGTEETCIDDVCYDNMFIVDGDLMEATNFTVLTGGSVRVFGNISLGSATNRMILNGVDAILDVIPCPTCPLGEQTYAMRDSYNHTASGMDAAAPGVHEL